MVLPVCRVPVSIFCAKRRDSNYIYSFVGGGQACPPFPAFIVPIFFSGQSVVVDFEGVRFRPESRRSGEISCVRMHAHF